MQYCPGESVKHIEHLKEMYPGTLILTEALLPTVDVQFTDIFPVGTYMKCYLEELEIKRNHGCIGSVDLENFLP